MKLYEITDVRPLNEINLKQAIAAGMIGAAALGVSKEIGKDITNPVDPIVTVDKTVDTTAVVSTKEKTRQVKAPTVNAYFKKLGNFISSKYKVNPNTAKEIVDLAHKHADPVFPTAKDILAVIGVESSYKPASVSGLNKDPAIGLMQVRPGVWKISPEELSTRDKQIEHGAKILRQYYTKLDRNESAAFQAYNVGITDFKGGKRAPGYLTKIRRELNNIKEI